MAVSSFAATGAKATSKATLPEAIFDIEVTNHQLLKDAYLAYMANGRVNLAKTLKRGQVSGGGIKPYPQKGTGRARTGSIRNPIWRGGGIVFGPSGNENYSRKVHIKARRLALRQALSLAAQNKNVCVIDDLVIKDSKTKNAAAILSKLSASSRTLIVVSSITNEILRATNNLPEVKVTSVSGLNVYDVMNAKNIVITKPSIELIEKRLGGTK